ncbi:MAG TPA: hypothetical protein VK630_00070, partial [Reyranella sp.]|nr:hypothetical protein [Reyranella sp.]
FNPFPQFETMGKQNMAMFEQAVRMLNPFVPSTQTGPQDSSKPALPAWSINPPAAVTETSATPPAAPKDAAIDDLKRKLDELQGQLAQLSKKS